jgi:hypothetical protein
MVKALTLCLCLFAGALSSGCATTPAAPKGVADQRAALAALLVGTYQSKPEEGARAGSPILQVIVRVEPPEGQIAALYSEMRHDGPNGPIYRQSLFVFGHSADEAGGLVMTALGFADPRAAEALKADPRLVRLGQLALTQGLGPGCTMLWRPDGDGYVGRIDPQGCEITGRRGDRRRIEAITRIGPKAIEHAEYGYDLAGNLLFGGPTGKRFVWPRLKTEPTSSGLDGAFLPRPGRGVTPIERPVRKAALSAGAGG